MAGEGFWRSSNTGRPLGGGMVTVGAAATTATVAHGLSVVPIPNQFVLTPLNDLGAASKWWVASADATSLVVAVDVVPGAGSTAEFVWRAFEPVPVPEGEPPTYYETVEADSPLNLLPLDDTSGTTAVATVGSNGTYVGTPTFGVTGPARVGGSAVRLNGSSQYVDIAQSTGPTTVAAQSWEVWAYHPTQIDSSSGISPLVGTNQVNTAILFGSSTSAFTDEVVTIANDAGGSSDRTGWSGFTIPAGWHHHVFTYNGTQHGWTYYLDGAATGIKQASSGGALGFTSSGWNWYLGFTSSYSSAARYFSGDLAAFAVYGVELTAAQVLTHYSG